MSDPNQLNDPHGRHGYDPRQPRVPAGQSTGGQWTDADGSAVDGAPQRKIVRDTSGQEAWNFYYNMYRPDGSLAEQVVFNRDRSRIISEFNESGDADDWDERHTVITPDGNKVTFETNGDTQTVYDADGRALSESKWTEHGPEAQAIVQPAYAGGVRLAAKKALEAALALLPWLSTRNSRDGTAVLSFAADVYRPGIASGVGRAIDRGGAQESVPETRRCPSLYGQSCSGRQDRAEGLETFCLRNGGTQASRTRREWPLR